MPATSSADFPAVSGITERSRATASTLLVKPRSPLFGVALGAGVAILGLAVAALVIRLRLDSTTLASGPAASVVPSSSSTTASTGGHRAPSPSVLPRRRRHRARSLPLYSLRRVEGRLPSKPSRPGTASVVASASGGRAAPVPPPGTSSAPIVPKPGNPISDTSRRVWRSIQSRNSVISSMMKTRPVTRFPPTSLALGIGVLGGRCSSKPSFGAANARKSSSGMARANVGFMTERECVASGLRGPGLVRRRCRKAYKCRRNPVL